MDGLDCGLSGSENTPLRGTSIGLLDAVRVWAESHLEAVLGAQAEYHQRPYEAQDIE